MQISFLRILFWILVLGGGSHLPSTTGPVTRKKEQGTVWLLPTQIKHVAGSSEKKRENKNSPHYLLKGTGYLVSGK